MSILGERLVAARVLDLFAGSGALGLEALSRGADHATFVELGAPSLAAIKSKTGRNLFSTYLPERAHYSQAIQEHVPVWRFQRID